MNPRLKDRLCLVTGAAREDVRSMFSRIESEFAAPVAVLVNNAVWARFQPFAEIDPETALRMFAVGVHGLIWTMQAAVEQMERRGGERLLRNRRARQRRAAGSCRDPVDPQRIRGCAREGRGA